MTNDLFADKSFYFRNALVRANYENQKLNVDKTRLPRNMLFLSPTTVYYNQNSRQGAGFEPEGRHIRSYATARTTPPCE